MAINGYVPTCTINESFHLLNYRMIFFFFAKLRRKRKDNIYVLLTNPLSLLQHRKVCPQSSRSLISVTTPLQNTPRTLQNGLYFVNIYRNITDINFTPVTYVYTVQMQQKKKNKTQKSHPPSWDFSQTEQGSSQWQASAVQKKSLRRRVSCQDPWDSGDDHAAEWTLSAPTQMDKTPLHTTTFMVKLCMRMLMCGIRFYPIKYQKDKILTNRMIGLGLSKMDQDRFQGIIYFNCL